MIGNEPSKLDPSAYMSWIEVDLGAIRWNYRQFRNNVPDSVDVYAVIKADAYGHGAVEVAKTLLSESVTKFCVARVEEAIVLREAGITIPILVFAPPLLPQALLAAKYKLEAVICDPVHLNAVAQAQIETGLQIPVHIKTDVGMGRIGIKPSEVLSMIADCDAHDLQVTGLMSHFPCADSCDASATIAMADNFKDICVKVATAYPNLKPTCHISNSAATMRFPDSWFDAVRVGISLYGQYPSVDMERRFTLKPAMNLKTRIVYIKDVPAGTPISYCQTYRTPKNARLATLALGYADGYPRHASNKTEFLFHGRRAPQVGRVCMDQLIIDITDFPNARTGDEVLAFGSSGDDQLLAEDVAAKFDSIGYELTTRIGKRLPRFFLDKE